jgi:hypothetical protein
MMLIMRSAERSKFPNQHGVAGVRNAAQLVCWCKAIAESSESSSQENETENMQLTTLVKVVEIPFTRDNLQGESRSKGFSFKSRLRWYGLVA